MCYSEQLHGRRRSAGRRPRVRARNGRRALNVAGQAHKRKGRQTQQGCPKSSKKQHGSAATAPGQRPRRHPPPAAVGEGAREGRRRGRGDSRQSRPHRGQILVRLRRLLRRRRRRDGCGGRAGGRVVGPRAVARGGAERNSSSRCFLVLRLPRAGRGWRGQSNATNISRVGLRLAELVVALRYRRWPKGSTRRAGVRRRRSRRRRGRVPFGWFCRFAAPSAARRVSPDRRDVATWILRGDASQRRRGCDVDIRWGRIAATPRPGTRIRQRRGAAAAATWTLRGDESRRRRDRDVEIPWR